MVFKGENEELVDRKITDQSGYQEMIGSKKKKKKAS